VLVRDCLQEILDIENSLEIQRKELAFRNDFTLGGVWEIFARTMQQKLPVEEFLFGLDRMDMAFPSKDIELFFQRYDSD